MKFTVQMKDPDGPYDAVQDAVKESLGQIQGLSDQERESLVDVRVNSVNELLAKWFEFGEYLTVEIDTDAKTCVVKERK